MVWNGLEQIAKSGHCDVGLALRRSLALFVEHDDALAGGDGEDRNIYCGDGMVLCVACDHASAHFGSNRQRVVEVEAYVWIIEIHVHAFVREEVGNIVKRYRSEAVECKHWVKASGSGCDCQVSCGVTADA